MFFLPPDEFWYLTVAKLEIKFDDNRKGAGTGFFIYDYKNYYLVTARHVVDPTYDPTKKQTQAKLVQLDMGFQCAINPGTPEATHGYHGFTVTNIDFNYADDDVDVAVLKIPSTVLPSVGAKGTTRPCSFSIKYLATDKDLATRYAGEPVVFVGYPDNAPIHEIEGKKFFYPLLRQGVFSYPPIYGIDIQGQLGRNYGLIDSFAQSGFSAAPIVSLQKGWADGSWHPKEQHRPPKVVGLVCGHYRSREDRADNVHAGLSFFARSTSILTTINKIQSAKEPLE